MMLLFMNIQDQIAQDINDMISESAIVDVAFRQNHQVWVRTKNGEVFRVTVEPDSVVMPDDFNA